ncbi:ribonuclease H-like domain-containing protein [Rhizophagus clarus]|uniref:Ribonuclease H-like domain-containing protein n=1 Tax=Rhizophagus clarus TaxID=94130 RepID=A0A8H3LG69_9GLOM|nr:ribonuclease H-like domain-containing protein [Rhizophagus clarus]
MEEVDPKRQKVNKDYEEEVASVRSFGSFVLASSSSTHFNSKPNTIKNNLIRTPTKNEIPKFERLLLRMSVANGFSFQWIDHPATLELFHFLNPHLILPNRKALSDYILKKEIKSLNTLRDEKLISDKIGVVLISQIKLVILAKSLNIKLNAIVSDSAPAYAAARRRLQLQFPEIVFLPCFAHQCQLAIGDIFKESPTLKAASSKAITVAAYFKNTNNSYFIGKLQDIQTLRNLAIRHERPQTGSENTEELYLNSGLCQILLDNDWWEKIELLQDILLPYCGVLNKLQCDKARLFEVLHAIGYFMQFWKHFPDSNLNFEDYRQKIKPFNNETWEQFGDDAFKFWGYVQGDYKELAAVALKLFGMYVNAASVERMWSSMGFLHMAHHNRLKNKKVLAMSQLRAAINFSLREKELQQNQIHSSDPNTFPIDTGSEDATPKLNVEEIEDDIEDNTIFTSEHWEQELEKWEEMLIEEELARLEGEEELRNNSVSLKEGSFKRIYTSSSRQKAKWELKNLFSSSLSIPNYLDVKSN